jgi:hypothetical protein
MFTLIATIGVIWWYGFWCWVGCLSPLAKNESWEWVAFYGSAFIASIGMFAYLVWLLSWLASWLIN